jgi:hypothetical protein
MFEAAFSSWDDEVIADAVCAWIADGDHPPPGSHVRCFSGRVERNTPFSPRLRRASTRAIERIWRSELEVSELETVRLLNRLDVDVDGMEDRGEWVQLLVKVLPSPMGLEMLSPHYWRLLDKLVSAEDVDHPFTSDVSQSVMRRLVEDRCWEKLEFWMAIVWQSFDDADTGSKYMEDVEHVTLNLLLERQSALPRFMALCEEDPFNKEGLQRICDQARAEQLPPESPSPS